MPSPELYRILIINCALLYSFGMKYSMAIGALFLANISLTGAFEIPFKLPFGLSFPFVKSGPPELFSLHKDLISIPSTTGSEHDVGVFLANYLQERNYTVERIPSFIPTQL